MKLTVNTKKYSLGKACNCSKAGQTACGINQRMG